MPVTSENSGARATQTAAIFFHRTGSGRPPGCQPRPADFPFRGGMVPT